MLFYNEDQEQLYELVKLHNSWSPAELIKHKDVQTFIGYTEEDHQSCRHRLAGRLQFLKARLKKIGIAVA